ncbi:MAG: RagB/SusD family nutrient uptake outer membrane protein [Gemmatimonadaceae bacterium]
MTEFLSGWRARVLPRLALAVVAIGFSACNTDDLVKVSDPATLRPADLNNLGSVPALVNGAFRQFIGGYSGFGLDDSFLAMTAVLSDETYYGDTFTTRQAADQRNLQPTVLGNISDLSFNRLHQARFNARRAYGVVEQFSTPLTAAADAVTKAQLRTIEGYVYVTLSEGWCGDVPFSVLPDVGDIDPTAIQGGVGLTTSQMNDTAVTRFNQAITNSSANQLAAVGKARALLNNGQFAAAAAAVAAVPTTYVFLLQHSQNTAAENNPMYALQSNGRYGVANLEGGLTAAGAALRTDTASGTTAPGGSAEGLAFRGMMDPRVPWEIKPTNGLCFSSGFRCKLNDNYPNFDADVPLASGVEARLIEAEAALQAGDPATMLAKLNLLRANSAAYVLGLYPGQTLTNAFKINGSPIPLAPLADPADPAASAADQFAARRELVFRERALWLYNTGHRLGDLRRLARAPYNLATTAVFPSGPFFRGGNYGNDVNYPIPFTEQNNTAFSAASCSTTTP